MQDVFFVAIGKYVVKIDINEAKQSGGSEAFSTEHPLVCRLGDACKGISVTAQHDDVITDFAVPFSDPCRLTSASKDGTVDTILKLFPFPSRLFDHVLSVSTRY